MPASSKVYLGARRRERAGGEDVYGAVGLRMERVGRLVKRHDGDSHKAVAMSVGERRMHMLKHVCAQDTVVCVCIQSSLAVREDGLACFPGRTAGAEWRQRRSLKAACGG